MHASFLLIFSRFFRSRFHLTFFSAPHRFAIIIAGSFPSEGEMGMNSSSLKKGGSESEGSGHSYGGGGGREERGSFEYFGWVYHIGVNSIGQECCHLRFLYIRRKYFELFKRDPHENPGIRSITRGIVGPSLMVEELGRRKVNHGDVYVLQIYNRLEESKKGEIACATEGEVRKWMEAFDRAKQQEAEYELSKGG